MAPTQTPRAPGGNEIILAELLWQLHEIRAAKANSIFALNEIEKLCRGPKGWELDPADVAQTVEEGIQGLKELQQLEKAWEQTIKMLQPETGEPLFINDN